MIAYIYPESLWPDWVWRAGADLMFLTGVVAALMYGYSRGPGLLIKYGPNWMTTTGRWLLKMTGRTDGQMAESGTKGDDT